MTQQFDAFVKEFRELCHLHQVCIEGAGRDENGMQVWAFASDDEQAVPLPNLEDCTGPDCLANIFKVAPGRDC